MRKQLAASGLVVALAALTVLPAAAQGRSLTVVNADVQMSLARDSSLLVDERLTVDYSGSWEATYRDIPLLHGEQIKDVRVSEAGRSYGPGGCTVFKCTDRAGVFGVTTNPDGNGPRIVWHPHASDEQRTFDVTYRVASTNATGETSGVADGATVAYDDVIVVSWAVWGSQWEFDLSHLTASVTDPNLDPANPDYRVWGHPRDVEGVTSRDDGVARLSADDVLSGTAVEMRVTIPRQPGQDVSGARRVSGDGLAAVLAEERGLDEDFNAPWPTFKRFVAHNATVLSLGLAAVGGLMVLLLMLYARERKVSVPKYLSGPPEENVPPALAYGIAYEGKDSANTVLATLLDLTDRCYYVASSVSTSEEKQDLAIGKHPSRPSPNELTDYEQEVLNFFDDVVEGYSVPISEMRDRIPKHSSTWRAKWQSMTTALNDAELGQLHWDRNVIWAQWFVGFVLAALFAGIALIDYNVRHEWIVPAAIGAVTVVVTFLIPSTRMKRLKPEQRERSAQWQAFARWTENFPRLDDDPPATLQLWKRILVYGVAFGTAERMITSGRIPAPVAEAASSDGSWSTYAFAGAFTSTTFDGGSFGSGFSSQVAPESSSGGGGGGFSGGGGGGFSGGGGGGGW